MRAIWRCEMQKCQGGGGGAGEGGGVGVELGGRTVPNFQRGAHPTRKWDPSSAPSMEGGDGSGTKQKRRPCLVVQHCPHFGLGRAGAGAGTWTETGLGKRCEGRVSRVATGKLGIMGLSQVRAQVGGGCRGKSRGGQRERYEEGFGGCGVTLQTAAARWSHNKGCGRETLILLCPVPRPEEAMGIRAGWALNGSNRPRSDVADLDVLDAACAFPLLRCAYRTPPLVPGSRPTLQRDARPGALPALA